MGVDGKIIEKGTHDELMNISDTGFYKKLVDKQDHRGSSRSSSLRSSPNASRESSYNDLSSLSKTKTTLNSINDQRQKNSNITAVIGDESNNVHHIAFKNVKFAYPTRTKKNVFDGFNLSINRGETIALVGPSGGGKSTTIGLIERFYDPIDGVVEYDGHDIKSLNLHWFRDQIGYVGQEPTLFNDSIANNIRYGAP